MHDYRCSDYNVVLDKEAAVIILNMLIQKQERDRRAAGACVGCVWSICRPLVSL